MARVNLPRSLRPTVSEVAALYRVCEKTVRDIWGGRTWRSETQSLRFAPNGVETSRIPPGHDGGQANYACETCPAPPSHQIQTITTGLFGGCGETSSGPPPPQLPKPLALLPQLPPPTSFCQWPTPFPNAFGAYANALINGPVSFSAQSNSSLCYSSDQGLPCLTPHRPQMDNVITPTLTGSVDILFQSASESLLRPDLEGGVNLRHGGFMAGRFPGPPQTAAA
eukprot:CAMPEP_0113719898 /NCGR_PEP_ID=MMETSP0038_2-20120614/36126_1 /TAXON_ID=2898 /ORGANISM="Cryptomonas paramecium" /LENGTH=223 /DNA_ID=CAMNT_0000648433 /DNA_START=93 /DNA_END=760 /DNA_ORIENTATION=+ /assembly_acc=CAM_ASM_000170